MTQTTTQSTGAVKPCDIRLLLAFMDCKDKPTPEEKELARKLRDILNRRPEFEESNRIDLAAAGTTIHEVNALFGEVHQYSGRENRPKLLGIVKY